MEFVRRIRIGVPASELFAWHGRPGALERLVPPWQRFEVVSREGGIEDGRMVARIGVGPFRSRWVAVHRGFQAGRQFRDEQVAGPFRRWVHTHTVEPDGDGAWLEDRIDYEAPFGLGRRTIGRMLERSFAYRHAVTAVDLERHHAVRAAGSLRIAITGATGLIGSQLAPFLTTGGHTVKTLRRGPPVPGETIAWDPAAGTIDAAALEGLDAVVHLAGEPIAHRWSQGARRRIMESRREGTRLLAETLAKLERPPRVLVSTSAVGYYGDRGDDLVDETAAPGSDFLAEVCQAWEAATAPAVAAGIRVVLMRVGIVLSPAGGALGKMLTPFKLGAGGRIGNGQQWMSWIAIDDLIGAYHAAIFNPALSGPVNAVAPTAVTNRDFTRTLGRVLGRPSFMPLPAFAVKTLFGEMGQGLLLAGQHVVPTRLAAAGFTFQYPELEPALRHLLGR